MSAFFDWWDSVEEWLTGLSFVPQLLVTVAVVIPVAILIAYVLTLFMNMLEVGAKSRLGVGPSMRKVLSLRPERVDEAVGVGR